MLDAVSNFSLPADVRSAGADAQKNYKSALAFEQMLVGELVKEMVPKDSEMSDGPYASTMQDTLSTALVGGQGLGLARQLYKEMEPGNRLLGSNVSISGIPEVAT